VALLFPWVYLALFHFFIADKDPKYALLFVFSTLLLLGLHEMRLKTSVLVGLGMIALVFQIKLHSVLIQERNPESFYFDHSGISDHTFLFSDATPLYEYLKKKKICHYYSDWGLASVLQFHRLADGYECGNERRVLVNYCVVSCNLPFPGFSLKNVQ